jgi:hypothetical protein
VASERLFAYHTLVTTDESDRQAIFGAVGRRADEVRAKLDAMPAQRRKEAVNPTDEPEGGNLTNERPGRRSPQPLSEGHLLVRLSGLPGRGYHP